MSLCPLLPLPPQIAPPAPPPPTLPDPPPTPPPPYRGGGGGRGLLPSPQLRGRVRRGTSPGPEPLD